MARPEVSGVGVERDDSGSYVLAVHLVSDDPALRAAMPKEIEGHPIRYIESGIYTRLTAEEPASGLPGKDEA